jgi:CheY-like chemotaxis protein
MLKMSLNKMRMPDNPMILIVEDNRVNQLLLMNKFTQQGFHSLLLAKNGYPIARHEWQLGHSKPAEH